MLFLAFLIRLGRFAQSLGGLGDIQHVVDDLKGQADPCGELGQQHIGFRIDLRIAEQRTDLHGDPDERTRFPGVQVTAAD